MGTTGASAGPAACLRGLASPAGIFRLRPAPPACTIMRSRQGGRLSDRVFKAPSSIHGFGCFARIGFQPGDLIGTYAGPEVQQDGTYVLWVYDAEGEVLVARDGRNLLRWINHSPDPNAEFEAFELYARRQILPGEEITIDYRGPDPAADTPLASC